MRLHEYLGLEGSLTVSELRKRINAKSDNQIRQWQHGYKTTSGNARLPSPANCIAIEKATDGKVTRRDLRPIDCEAIWPELAVSNAAA